MAILKDPISLHYVFQVDFPTAVPDNPLTLEAKVPFSDYAMFEHEPLDTQMHFMETVIVKLAHEWIKKV